MREYKELKKMGKISTKIKKSFEHMSAEMLLRGQKTSFLKKREFILFFSSERV